MSNPPEIVKRVISEVLDWTNSDNDCIDIGWHFGEADLQDLALWLKEVK